MHGVGRYVSRSHTRAWLLKLFIHIKEKKKKKKKKKTHVFRHNLAKARGKGQGKAFSTTIFHVRGQNNNTIGI